MDNLLYYPYINIPKSDWSVRALLYYDTIGAIVPYQFLYDRERYDPFMRELVDNKLVKPIDPIENLSNSRGTTDQFIKYILQETPNLKTRRKSFKRDSLSEVYESKFSTIHAGKFDSELFYQLKQAGLASKKADSEVYHVEKKTANELMTFIATVLGVKLNYLPISDKISIKNFKVVGIKNKHVKQHKQEAIKRGLILNQLIPFPQQFNLTSLRVFKDKHIDLLNAFKNKVESLVLDPVLDSESDLFQEKIKELTIRKIEIGTKMNESNLVTKYITVAGLAGAVPDLLSDSATDRALGIINLSGAILAALAIENPTNIFDQSGMKYLALAEKNLIN